MSVSVPWAPMEERLVCLVLVGGEPELMCESLNNKSCPPVESFQCPCIPVGLLAREQSNVRLPEAQQKQVL